MNENETIVSLDPYQIFLKGNPTIQLKNLNDALQTNMRMLNI